MADKTPEAYFSDDCIITFTRKGGTPLTVTTDVGNFEESGGNTDVEQKAYYGGAFITIKKPQEQYEVAFDVKLNDTKWAQIMSDTYASSGSASYVISGGENYPYKIKLEWLGANTPTPAGSVLGSNFGAGYKVIYYDAYGVEFSKSGPSEEELQGKIKFKLNPANTNAYGLRYEATCSDFANAVGSNLYNAIETGSCGPISTGSGNTLLGY